MGFSLLLLPLLLLHATTAATATATTVCYYYYYHHSYEPTLLLTAAAATTSYYCVLLRPTPTPTPTTTTTTMTTTTTTAAATFCHLHDMTARMYEGKQHHIGHWSIPLRETCLHPECTCVIAGTVLDRSSYLSKKGCATSQANQSNYHSLQPFQRSTIVRCTPAVTAYQGSAYIRLLMSDHAEIEEVKNRQGCAQARI